MKFKYHAYYPIVDFIEIDFGATETYNFINEINNIIESDKNGKLYPDWTICFYFIYTKYSEILINKQGNIIKNEKIKEHNIIIPIPNNKEISWGIKKNKFPNDISHNKNSNNENIFIELSANYNEFSNMKDYVMSCSKKAIISLLINGLMLEGIKIEFSEKTIFEIRKLDNNTGNVSNVSD